MLSTLERNNKFLFEYLIIYYETNYCLVFFFFLKKRGLGKKGGDGVNKIFQ